MEGSRGNFESWYPTVTRPIWRELSASAGVSRCSRGRAPTPPSIRPRGRDAADQRDLGDRRVLRHARSASRAPVCSHRPTINAAARRAPCSARLLAACLRRRSGDREAACSPCADGDRDRRRRARGVSRAGGRAQLRRRAAAVRRSRAQRRRQGARRFGDDLVAVGVRPAESRMDDRSRDLASRRDLARHVQDAAPCRLSRDQRREVSRDDDDRRAGRQGAVAAPRGMRVAALAAARDRVARAPDRVHEPREPAARPRVGARARIAVRPDSAPRADASSGC